MITLYWIIFTGADLNIRAAKQASFTDGFNIYKYPLMKKPKMVKTELDQQIMDLAKQTDQKTLMLWACDCAERALSHFEKNYPEDKRPRQAIKAGRKWERTGIFKMNDVRGTSLAAHAAARSVVENDAARSAARAAGQAMATAHVATHSIVAAIYAATAIRDAAEIADENAAALKERRWQYQHLLDLRSRH